MINNLIQILGQRPASGTGSSEIPRDDLPDQAQGVAPNITATIMVTAGSTPYQPPVTRTIAPLTATPPAELLSHLQTQVARREPCAL